MRYYILLLLTILFMGPLSAQNETDDIIFKAMQDEMKKLQDAKVSNSSMYIAVQDKWMEQIDKTYKEIFTEEQWGIYLKNGAAKHQKAREKRKQKAIEAERKLKERLGKL